MVADGHCASKIILKIGERGEDRVTDKSMVSFWDPGTGSQRLRMLLLLLLQFLLLSDF